MASLAHGFVVSQQQWDLPTGSAIDIADISRVAGIADHTGAPTGTDDRVLLLSTLQLREGRFTACVPSWSATDAAFGWLPVEATGVVQTAGCDAGAGIVPVGNTLLRAPFAADPLPEFVDELDTGLYTLGGGKDFEAQPIDPNLPRLNPIGAPLRIGQTDTDLFFSRSTPETTAWLSRDPDAVLGSDPAIVAILDELDTHNVFTARIAQAIDPMADLRESRAPNRDELIAQRDPWILIRQPCDYVAVGAAELDGGIITYVIYSFPDSHVAAAAMPSITESWTADSTNQIGEPIDGLINEVTDLTQRDHLIVVTLDAGENTRWLVEDAGKRAPLACMGDA